ncbi:Rossmann-like and DUF2520 domain-containing protein [Halotalea alkalilenta]|uniref:DUF2520 domain-containing protein n=1 Tax=Halotalea alkalilenta TaxID=376489 RepID=A0A172YC20_9GAMM|nr:DUF2520 domain-containing protein [Halotalea alkalilenta]ANF56801.1 hypothetical protein A5892_04395 [Halotalea alkalilenta]
MSSTYATIGFIGPGRLATALSRALAGNGEHVAAIAGRSHARAQALAERLPDCEALPAQALVERCELVFVTAADDAIAATVEALDWRPGNAVVHASGATEISVLAKAARAGAAIGGFHPMQSFSDPDTAIASLPGCTLTIEAEGALLSRLEAIAQRLGGRVNRLPPGARARYHAAASYASPFMLALLDEATRIWASWGASREDALAALLPLLRGTLGALERGSLEEAITGPIARHDLGTVRKHLAALDQLGGRHGEFYRLLAARQLEIRDDASSRPEAMTRLIES